ncbi:MAG: type II toxin-antitoxin system antitoxin SocA domain-containing protein [Candidatus Saccharibacteria bacterium]
MSFKSTIKQLRTNAGISQQEVADKVGVARATYAGLESGRRDPNLTEIRNIAEFYQVSPSELIDGIQSRVEEPVTPYKFSDQNDIIPRDINPQVNPEKLREVLLYVLEKVGAKPNVGETVLYKLLYFIDFDYYEKYGQSITGLTYIRNHFGPTPAVTFAEIVQGMEQRDELEIVETKFFNNKQRKYLPNVKLDLQNLSAKELTHINEELARLSDKTATELSELSHYDTPWVVAKQGEKIEYRDVFYRTIRTAVTEPEDDL